MCEDVSLGSDRCFNLDLCQLITAPTDVISSSSAYRICSLFICGCFFQSVFLINYLAAARVGGRTAGCANTVSHLRQA